MSTSVLSVFQPRATWADWAGMTASIGCAIHCAAMPLVLAYLPALGLSWLADEGFHQWMAAICFGLAAVAFIPGWRKHGSFVPAIWGLGGVLLLATAAFGMEDSCCPSCLDSEAAVAPTTELECSECAAAAEVASASTSPVAWASMVTPLGGLLLVVGHIVNHLKSCQCQGDHCCLGEGEAQT